MNIALCFENVNPARGGCETYIADLMRRLVADGHTVHLYGCRCETAALPAAMTFHRLSVPRGPRFLRPWRFAAACERALAANRHDVSVGFDKTWGQDVLYPQGGLHAASADHNIRKHASPLVRGLARLAKRCDLAARSFARLERKQYFENRPTIIVNSEMVAGHFRHYHGVPAERLHVIRSAIDPNRFHSADRLRVRAEWRERWRLRPEEPAGLFVAMNYRLKGLEPLLHAVALVPHDRPFRLVVVGHSKTARYERLARRLGVADRVVFHGFCAETRNAYFAGDFLVHPTFYDPCSLVALEALACGLPVITSRYNGASELLNPPYDGLVIDDPHDHRQLADCLVRMCDAEYRADAGPAAREAAGRWTFEQHYRRMIQVFTDVAARKQAA
ncbi:MAG: glycosyltransferase family 4 protein [Gemmataceae bacterium]